jgi:fluoride exporter
MMNLTWLLLGGMMGTLARYTLVESTSKFFGNAFPFGTLLVNLSGCFLAGLFISAGEGRFSVNPSLRLFLLFGFCGAFTTFSAFILETSQLIRAGQSLQAFANVAVSFMVGFFMFRLGVLAGAGMMPAA